MIFNGNTQTTCPQYMNNRFLISTTYTIMRSTSFNQSYITHNSFRLTNNHSTAFSSYEWVVVS